jgi:hypothetical protein
MNTLLLFILNCFFVFSSVYSIDHYPYSTNQQLIEFALKEALAGKTVYVPFDDSDMPQVKAIYSINAQEEVYKARIFDYNDQGKIIKQTLYGNLTGDSPHPIKIEEDIISEENEKYSIEYEYSTQEPTVLLKKQEDNGDSTQFFYDETFQLILVEKYHQGSQVPYEQRLFDEMDDSFDQNRQDQESIHSYTARGSPIQIETSGVQKQLRYQLDGSLCENTQYVYRNPVEKEVLPSRHDIPQETSLAICHQPDEIALINIDFKEPDKVSPPPPSPPQDTSWSLFGSIQNAFYSVTTAFSNAYQYIKQKENDLFKIEESVEKWLVDNFGRSFISFNGFYKDSSVVGVYGWGEVSDKVRVTAINGILTINEDWKFNVNMISETHGKVNIHYIFHPTEGWTWDIVRATLSKLGYSARAKMLADLWKDMIREMGGVNGGGIIIHYAHSLGGTNTLHAKDFMTPEELKMIKVITVGSATMIPNEDFQSAINYASKRDGICKLSFGYIKSCLGLMDNVVSIGSHWGYPIIDHLITSPTYRNLIEELGADFIKNYGERRRDKETGK